MWYIYNKTARVLCGKARFEAFPPFCSELPATFEVAVSVLTASLFVRALGALRTVHSVNLSVNKLRRILLNHMLSSLNPPSLYYAKNMR